MQRELTHERLHEALKKVFGFREFRPNQESVVRAILGGQDVFAVMPTGGGKSLCYQLPAVLLEGTCMVVSPLIALMKDQVDAARANGIRAAFFNSTLSLEERQGVIAALRAGELDLLYVAPERFALASFQELLSGVKISLAVIDEAHCISEWGHDFRPDYLSLSSLVELFSGTPVAAFTATATSRVQEDILRRLALRNPMVLRASFDRPNLTYEVRFKEGVERQLIALLEGFHGKAGIIYRTSRRSVDETAAMLQRKGFRALPYHAGLGDEERAANQEAFIRDEADVVVATVAFGMGIDKSNIRFVVHADLPRSIENYYQETGRAGRDGEPSACIMLYSASDIPKVRFFIDAMQDEGERSRALDALTKVAAYAGSAVCRRKALLAHFDEVPEYDNCGSCDICTGNWEKLDCTTEAQMLLSAIVRTESRFGASHIIDIVVGSSNRKIIDFGHDRLPTYAAGKGKPKSFWRQLVDELLARGIVARSEGLYPVLVLQQPALEVLRGREEVCMRRRLEPKGRKKGAGTPMPEGDAALFEQLRLLRKEIADEQGVPPYVVFSDRSLREMAARIPKSGEEMLGIAGVGEVKLSRYGRRFLDAIARWHDEVRPS